MTTEHKSIKLNIRKDFVKTLHRNKMGRGDCLYEIFHENIFQNC